MAILSGAWWYWVIISWYCLVLVVEGQHSAFMPVYIEQVDIWSGVTGFHVDFC